MAITLGKDFKGVTDEQKACDPDFDTGAMQHCNGTNHQTERRILEPLADALVRYVMGPMDVMAEYLVKDVKYSDSFTASDYTASGIMIFPTLNLRSFTGYDIQILGRYDMWDESDRSDSSKHKLNAITGGVNYNFMHDDSGKAKMNLQLNVTDKSYLEDDSAPAYADGAKDQLQVMAQLKWRFSNTLN
ncbi:MAG TPA: hypothetical protein PLO57_06800 [Candidatus Cloacimonadota bacterium]|nr:hypothetical protein [Candidatus Cloacimonadota bacterium]